MGKGRTSNTNEQGQYWCPRCEQYKDLTEFFAVAPSQRGKKSPHCKVCSNEIAYIYKQKKILKTVGPEIYLADLRKEEQRIKSRFEELYQMVEKFKRRDHESRAVRKICRTQALI